MEIDTNDDEAEDNEGAVGYLDELLKVCVLRAAMGQFEPALGNYFRCYGAAHT